VSVGLRVYGSRAGQIVAASGGVEIASNHRIFLISFSRGRTMSDSREVRNDAEARRLERERILELFAAIKADIHRHVPSGSDSVAVQEIFHKFEESVASS